MTPEQRQLVKQFFAEAVALPVAERGVYLEQVHEADAEVAQEVASLLQHHVEDTLLAFDRSDTTMAPLDDTPRSSPVVDTQSPGVDASN
ncbi:MAG: hypothetical protein KDB23_16145, partial [Planctomycetales bacterium]|nr:hypothetical protein [Planctomycetales bacterium]